MASDSYNCDNYLVPFPVLICNIWVRTLSKAYMNIYIDKCVYYYAFYTNFLSKYQSRISRYFYSVNPQVQLRGKISQIYEKPSGLYIHKMQQTHYTSIVIVPLKESNVVECLI